MLSQCPIYILTAITTPAKPIPIFKKRFFKRKLSQKWMASNPKTDIKDFTMKEAIPLFQ
jgi:hypothetical protein